MYAGTPYAGAPYGGALHPVARHLVAADRNELQRVAIEAAKIALEQDGQRGAALLEELGAPAWRERVDDVNAIMELLRNVVLVITLILGGASWTAVQVQRLLERDSGQNQLEQLPRSEDHQSQLEDLGHEPE